MDLIDREALKKEIKAYSEYDPMLPNFKAIKIIDNAPTVTQESIIMPFLMANQRPHGKWIEYGDIYNKGGVKCSICGYQTYNRLQLAVGCGNNFCPNCGADMREDNNET